MKKSFIVLGAALALAACGQQPNYQQTAQRQCDPQVSDCYGYGVGRDSHGDAILAGVVGGGLGYAAGRMSAQRDYERQREYDRQRSYDRDYDRDYRRPTTVVNKHYYNTPAPTTSYGSTRSAPVTVTRTAPITSSRPATRTMFGSARRR